MDPEREQKLILPKRKSQLNYSHVISLLNPKKFDAAGLKSKHDRLLADFFGVPCFIKEEGCPFGENSRSNG